jgi:hypothetical protein
MGALPELKLALENMGLFYCGSSVWMQMAGGLKESSVFLCDRGAVLRELAIKALAEAILTVFPNGWH